MTASGACWPSASSPTAATAAAWNGSDVTAIEGVVEGEFGQLGAQALGVLVLCTVMFGLAFAFFKIQNAVMKGGIRPTEADELAGLDLPEMGVLAYPEFEKVASRSRATARPRPSRRARARPRLIGDATST